MHKKVMDMKLSSQRLRIKVKLSDLRGGSDVNRMDGWSIENVRGRLGMC